ncbi:MFS transporter [Synechococcus sp. H60.4]|uniref:MFS transporter n=1 Tax=unclassified Synechococcus TaxID=2626047 RepID=UPI0039C15484
MTLFSPAWRFIVLLGIVSLCADATYEGARSISGAFLGSLGASGTVVGLVAGGGELLAYGLRLGVGYWSDRLSRDPVHRSRGQWQLTTLGYVLNTAVIPALAWVSSWPGAALLLLAERLGKGIRTPPRDLLLSHAALQVGQGIGFGLHETLDQIGAVGGPLLVAGMVAAGYGFQGAFLALGIPAALGLGVLGLAQWLYPTPRNFEPEPETAPAKGFSRVFWLYLTAAACVAMGFADFSLIALHLQQQGGEAAGIPLLYALAMGVDALAALGWGWLFDRLGLGSLLGAVVLSAGFAPLAFSGSYGLTVVGMLLWGIGLGAQESVMKAAVAGMVAAQARGFAFGLFTSIYGLAWFLGSALMGVLYDLFLPALVIFSVAAQAVGAAILWVLILRGQAGAGR